ncbi:MAG: spermidine synthase [Alteromonadaceae bacterium]|jgi:spermidine synthase
MQLSKHIQQGKLLYLNRSEGNISVSENDHYLWLAFDDVIQSVMLKRKPARLTLPHQIFIMLPLLFFRPQNVCELGLGGGNIGRFMTKLNDSISFVSIEYNKHVIECFKQFFNPEEAYFKISHQDARLWLQQASDRQLDWLICDIYQQKTLDFKDTLAQLSLLTEPLTCETCLTLNLPDSSDQEVNLCLTVLQQLQTSHKIIYFHVPNYLNIIIHLIPRQWQTDKMLLRNKQSYLAKHTFLRWRRFWQEKNEV